MQVIQNAAAYFFIVAVAILSAVSILGVWDFFAHDVILKSFETLGLLAVVSIVVIVAGRFLEARHQGEAVAPYVPSPAFRAIRRGTLALLIALAALLAFLGVMAIWDLIADKDVLWKSLGSLAIAAFAAYLMVLTCLEREKIPTTNSDGTITNNSAGLIGTILASLFFAWLMMNLLVGSFFH